MPSSSDVLCRKSALLAVFECRGSVWRVDRARVPSRQKYAERVLRGCCSPVSSLHECRYFPLLLLYSLGHFESKNLGAMVLQTSVQTDRPAPQKATKSCLLFSANCMPDLYHISIFGGAHLVLSECYYTSFYRWSKRKWTSRFQVTLRDESGEEVSNRP